MKRVRWFGEGADGLQPVGQPRREVIKPRGRRSAKPVAQTALRTALMIECKIALPESEIAWHIANRERSMPACERHWWISHGEVPLTVADQPRQRQPTRLSIRRLRRRCKVCGAIAIQVPPDIDHEFEVTERLRHDILCTAIKHSFGQAASMLGVDRKKVVQVFRACVEEILPERSTRLPSVICIDETLLGGEYRFICYDPIARTVIDILEDMENATIEAFFKSFENRDEVATIVSDMRPSYLKIAENLFDATVVVDRFHIVAPINKAMRNARARVMRALRREKGGRDKSMRIREVDHLLAERRDPHPNPAKERQLQRIWDIRLTGDLLGGRKPMPKYDVDGEYLRRAYEFKEDLQDLYGFPDAEGARAQFVRLMKQLIQDKQLRLDFKDAALLIAKHRRYILNFYKDKQTNGFAEGMNKCLKQIEAVQSGIAFEDLRAKGRLRYGDVINRDELQAY